MSLPMDWLDQMKEMERLKIQNRLLKEENKKLQEENKRLRYELYEELEDDREDW